MSGRRIYYIPYPRRVWLFVVFSRRIAWGKVNYVVYSRSPTVPARTGSRITERRRINRIRTGTNRSGATRIAAAGVKSKNAVVPLLHGYAVWMQCSSPCSSFPQTCSSCFVLFVLFWLLYSLYFFLFCLTLSARMRMDIESDDVWHKQRSAKIPGRSKEGGKGPIGLSCMLSERPSVVCNWW